VKDILLGRDLVLIAVFVAVAAIGCLAWLREKR
jgi:hypothetical protein